MKALKTALAVLLAVAPIDAHHSFAAEFDAKQPISCAASSPTWSGSIRIPGSIWMRKTPMARW